MRSMGAAAVFETAAETPPTIDTGQRTDFAVLGANCGTAWHAPSPGNLMLWGDDKDLTYSGSPPRRAR
jgi:hypothetical protein